MKTRVITALIAGALVILLLIFRNALWGMPLCIVIMLLQLLAMHEIFSALHAKGASPARWPAYLTAVLMLVGYLWRGADVMWIVFSMGVVLALCCAIFRRSPSEGDIIATAFPFVYPMVPFMALLMIATFPEPFRISILLAVLISSIASDIFALVAGMLFGKHKLIPSVSPKKTWEGAIGGLLMGIVCTTIFGAIANQLWQMDLALWHFALLGAVGSVATQFGDLVASSIKRYCGVKDFGKIFPGHGGVLDRLDGILINAVCLCAYAVLAIPGVLR